jgi:hypothetical protein
MGVVKGIIRLLSARLQDRSKICRARTVARICCIAILSCAVARSEDGLSRWNWRLPAPQGNALLSVAIGNNRYVAVGDRGAIMTSTNATDWQVADSPISDNLRSVRFGVDRFVAVGMGGSIVLSLDGDHWTIEKSGVQETLTALAVKDGVFIAVSAEGTILRSLDGKTWTTQYKAPQPIWSVTAGTDFFLVPNGRSALISRDGAIWEAKPILWTGASLFEVAYGGGLFLGLASYVDPKAPGMSTILVRSTNGVDWAEVPVQAAARLRYANGLFYQLSARTLLASADGTIWTNVAPALPDDFTDIQYGDGQYLLSGYLPTIHTSAEGVHWTNHTTLGQKIYQLETGYGGLISLLSDGFYRVLCGNGAQVVIASTPSITRVPAILSSRDGIKYSETLSLANGLILGPAAYGGGKFHVLGLDRAVDGTITDYMFRSTDGFNWTRDAVNTPGSIWKFAWGDSHFVGFGSYYPTNYILRSSDGLQWEATPISGTNVPADIIYGGGRFIMCGSFGSIWASCDEGVSWEKHNTGTTEHLLTLGAGDSRIVAVGTHGAAATTLDLNNWICGQAGTNDLHSITYGNGVFLAASGATIYASTDGVQWRSLSPGLPLTISSADTTPDVHDIVFSENRFTAVGSRFLPNGNVTSGFILQSGPVTSLRAKLDHDSLAIVFPGGTNAMSGLEISEDLHGWRPLDRTVSESGNVIQLPRPPSKAFYRVRLQP